MKNFLFIISIYIFSISILSSDHNERELKEEHRKELHRQRQRRYRERLKLKQQDMPKKRTSRIKTSTLPQEAPALSRQDLGLPYARPVPLTQNAYEVPTYMSVPYDSQSLADNASLRSLETQCDWCGEKFDWRRHKLPRIEVLNHDVPRRLQRKMCHPLKLPLARKDFDSDEEGGPVPPLRELLESLEQK